MIEAIEPLSLNDLLARAVQTLGELLPDDWETSLKPASDDPYADRRLLPDALLEVVAPDGTAVEFAIAAKLTVTGREAAELLARLLRWDDERTAPPLLVARYLSTTAQDLALAAGASFLDATGNARIAARAPGLVLVQNGLDRDPWRRGATRDNLRGEPAARVARALCDFTTPLPVARLIELAESSAGATYRVLDLLIDEGLATKGERGWIDAVDWQRLLRRWASDYAAAEQRYILHFKLPAGSEAALKQLAREAGSHYVLGGDHAASRFDARSAPAGIFIHSDDAGGLAARLGASLAGGESDLLIHARGLPVAAARCSSYRKLRFASPSQAYADLVLGRSEQSAEQLLAAMIGRESEWRDKP